MKEIRIINLELKETKYNLDYIKKNSIKKKPLKENNIITNEISNNLDIKSAEILYSICTEMFIDRANFKEILFLPYYQENNNIHNEFSPNIFFTNVNEFGPF